MAKNSIRDFDATSSNNTDIQSVDISEGCSPSGINNAIRELMADIKDVSAGTVALESPSADSMTVTGGLRVNDEIAINTTAKTWDASTDAVQFQSGSLWNFSTSQLNLDQNVYYNGAYKYLNAGAASEYSQASGAHFFKVASTGSADADITFSTALTVANSGNIGIGTSAPHDSGANFNMLTLNGAKGGGIVFSDDDVNQHQIYTTDDASLRFARGSSLSSETMRIDSSGNLLVGTTSSNGKLAIGDFSLTGADYGVAFVDGSDIFFIRSSTNTSTNNAHYQFYNTNGQVGSITTNGSATSFNTSSDYRLKENIVDAPSSSSDIDAIQVRSFDWKVDGSHQKYGMIAQELLTVAPEAVSQPEDSEEMMGVDYSKLVPMMIKEIQTLRQRITDLENA